MIDPMLPRMTIMIPTYNQEGYIAEAIESALAQDYPNIEVLVADDCSTDKTGEIAKQYIKDSRFRYIRNEKNLGRVGNYHNTLYSHATGEWVVNLDGDDYYTDAHYVSRAMQRIMSQPDVVCYFAKRYISKKLKRIKDKEIDQKTWIFDGKDFFLNYFNYGGFAHAGAFYRRDIALQDRKCYTYPGIQSDFHGIIRYTVFGNVVFTHDKGYFWRVHNNNATTSVSNIEKYRSERQCQMAVIKDMQPGILTDEEIKDWIEAGRLWAKHQFVKDCLLLSPTIPIILYALRHYQFSLSYNIILVKAILKRFGFKVKV